MEPAITNAANDPTVEAAFKRELVALIPHLRAFARTLAGDPAAADDLAQDAMMKAWDARASYQMGTNMKAWTFMILRNQFYSEKRRSWRQSQLDQEAAERTLVAVDDPEAPVALDEEVIGGLSPAAEHRESPRGPHRHAAAGQVGDERRQLVLEARGVRAIDALGQLLDREPAGGAGLAEARRHLLALGVGDARRDLLGHIAALFPSRARVPARRARARPRGGCRPP